MTPRQRWISVLTWTVVATLAATAAFTDLRWHASWQYILKQAAANAIVSSICAASCLLVLPALVPAARRRLPLPLDWALIVAVLIVMGAAGSFVAMLALVALRFVPASRFFAAWYPGSLKASIYLTLIFGLSGTVIHELRGRLARTTVALRTKERDEADARRLAAEAQLASLESRVDPHFLFNTLNTIAALVRDKPAEAERVIEQLSSLMRSSLDRRASLVPLDDELDVVRSYLDIERVRFGDRLRFSIDPLHGAGAPLVPRLALQTLVENSVKFAVSPSRDGASLAVQATAAGGRLRVAVIDDGPGFDVSSLPDGHGLQLLKSRLLMAFGDRAALVAESRPGRTVVTLDLPFETVIPQTPPANPAPAPAGDLPMLIRAYVVDDEPLAVQRLTRLLNDTGRVEVAGSATDPQEALDALRHADVDVVFLDIQMPEMTGFELVERLDRQVPVVFTTAYDRYALEAFAVNSIDYLLKPVEAPRLAMALDKLERFNVSGGGQAAPDIRALARQLARELAPGRRLERVASRAGERTTVLDVSRVTHFFAKDKLTFAVSGGREHVVDFTMAELESHLDTRRFVRIHRATIVNVAFVQELYPGVDGLLLRLKDDARSELSVARDRVRELKERLGI